MPSKRRAPNISRTMRRAADKLQETKSGKDGTDRVDSDDDLDDFKGFEKEEAEEEDSQSTSVKESKAETYEEKKRKMEREDGQIKGFARGLQLEKILGATNDPGEIVFLVKWKGRKEAELVKAKEANLKVPQAVIKFYEERIVWGKHYFIKP